MQCFNTVGLWFSAIFLKSWYSWIRENLETLVLVLVLEAQVLDYNNAVECCYMTQC